VKVQKLKGNSYYFVRVGEFTGNNMAPTRKPWGIPNRLAERVNALEIFLDSEMKFHVEEMRLFREDMCPKLIFEFYEAESVDRILLGTVDFHVETFSHFSIAYGLAVGEIHRDPTARVFLVKDSMSELWSIIHVVGETIYKET